MSRFLALTLFFGSGLTSLIYEVVWMRRLTLTFGHTVMAVSTVVTAFMLGLALGSLLGGRWADSRPRRWLATYGQLEIAIGLWGALSPRLLDSVDRWVAPNGVFSAFLGALLVLTPPTVLMGATLPVLSRVMVRELAEMGLGLSWLYGSNTLGASLGAALAGWWMLPTLGLTRSLLLTAAASVTLGAVAWAAARGPKDRPPRPGTEPAPIRAPGGLAAAMALAGIASMGLQLAWTRALAQLMGSSTYAFSTILALFLAGMGLGSGLLSICWFARRPGPRHLAGLLILTGAMAGASHAVLGALPDLALRLKPMLSPDLPRMLASSALLAGLVVLPATLLMGLSLPLAAVLESERLERLGRSLSLVYSVNTLGCILGASAVGFFGIPRLGVQTTLLLSAGAYLAAALLVWPRPAVGLAALAVAAGLFGLPAWSLARMGSAPGLYREVPVREPAFYRDGLSCTVTLLFDENGGPVLKVNGKTDASLYPGDLQTQLLCGYLPGFLHPRPERVAVIGLGSGLTAHALATFPALRALDVAELEPAVVEAGRYWSGFNGRLLQDPRLEIFPTDGRTFILSQPEGYDVIASEPSNPWIAGVANLFTTEFYRVCRQRLRPGGIMCQWLQLYGLSDREMRRILTTFFQVFPHGGVWQSAQGDLLLVGSEQPVELDLERVAGLYRTVPVLRRDLCSIELYRPETVAGLYVLDRETALRKLSLTPLNTDDLPLLEFSAPLSFSQSTASAMNWEVLAAARGSEPLLPPGVPDTPANRIGAGFAWIRLGRHADIRRLTRYRDLPDCRLVAARSAELLGDANAELLYKEALEEAPDDPLTLWLVAVGRIRAGQLEVARQLLERLERHPLFGFEEPVMLEHSNVLLRLNRGPEALQWARAATRLEGASFLAWTKLAQVQQSQGLSAEALQSFEAALRQNDCYVPARAGRAEILASLQRFGEAEEAFRALLELRPQEAGAWFNLGVCLERDGRPGEARRAYQKVLLLEPGHPRALARLKELSLRETSAELAEGRAWCLSGRYSSPGTR